MYGQGLKSFLKKAMTRSKVKAQLFFGYPVKDPSRFGIVELGKDNKILKLLKKPKNSKIKFGYYRIVLYDSSVVKLTKKIKKSRREN